jgi:hypothetical protein
LPDFLDRIGRQRQYPAAAVTLDFDLEGLLRAGADQPDPLLPGGQRLAIDRADAVSWLQIRTRRGPVLDHLADDGGNLGIETTDSQRLQRVLVELVGLHASNIQLHGAAALQSQFDTAARHSGAQQRQPQILKRADLGVVDPIDLVPCDEAGDCGRRAGRRLADHRLQRRQTVEEQRPVQHHRQQEIGHRTRQHDADAAPYASPVEGPMDFAGGYGALALVEHLDVAAQRQRADRPLGLVASEPAAEQGLAKADRKTQHLDSGQACRQVMAEFMDHDQHADRDQEPQHRVQ